MKKEEREEGVELKKDLITLKKNIINDLPGILFFGRCVLSLQDELSVSADE